jgi:hypothetical protein
MNRFIKVLVLPAIFVAALWQGPVEAEQCASNWSTNEYKSFGDVQTEVKKRYGEVRILRVALCDSGGTAYFQVIIISGQGEVRRVQVGAAQ